MSLNLYLYSECLVAVLLADKYPSTDGPRPYEEGPSIEIEEEVPGVHPSTLVENTFEGSMHGAMKGQDAFSYLELYISL